MGWYRAQEFGFDPRRCRGIHVGGCVAGRRWPRQSDWDVEAHAHNTDHDPWFGWICVASERSLFTASRRPTRVMVHSTPTSWLRTPATAPPGRKPSPPSAIPPRRSGTGPAPCDARSAAAPLRRQPGPSHAGRLQGVQAALVEHEDRLGGAHVR